MRIVKDIKELTLSEAIEAGYDVYEMSYSEMEIVVNDYLEENGVEADWETIDNYGYTRIIFREINFHVSKSEIRACGATKKEVKRILKAIRRAGEEYYPRFMTGENFLRISNWEWRADRFEMYLYHRNIKNPEENLTERELEILKRVCKLMEERLRILTSEINSFFDAVDDYCRETEEIFDELLEEEYQ